MKATPGNTVRLLFFLPRFGAVCLALWLVSPAPAQVYPAAAIPAALRQEAHAVIREEVKRFEVRSNREGRLYVRRVVTLFNDKSGADELAVYYDTGSKVGKIQAAIYDGEGRLVRQLGREEIRDVSAVSDYSIYDDNRVKLIEATHSAYPYTVVFEYEQDLSGISFAVFPDWYLPDYHWAVEAATFTIDAPSDFPVHYRAQNFEAAPQISDDGKRRVLVWQIRNLPAIKREAYGPPAGWVLPAVLTAPGNFQIGAYSGSMDSWEAFSRFIHQLYVGRDGLPAEVAAEIRRLTAGAASNAERIALIYAYLRRNVRYVSVQLGIGGWQPFDAQYVGAKKYGDCKALTNYMMALLREVGIEACPALIRSGDPGIELSDDFATSRFNHVVLYVPSEDCWLECTSDNFPANYLGLSNADRPALLVLPKGGRLLRTPALDREENVEHTTTTIELSASGSARIRVQQTSTGADHEFYRHMAGHYSAEEQQKWLHQSSHLPTFSIEALNVKVAPDRPEARLDYQVQAPRFAAVAGKRIFAPLNAVHPFTTIPEELPERRQPIVLRRGYTERDTLLFQLPEGYELESAGAGNLSLDSDFGRYSLKVEPAGGTLRIFRELELRSGRWPVDRYGDFRSFFRDVARADAQKAVFLQKRT